MSKSLCAQAIQAETDLLLCFGNCKKQVLITWLILVRRDVKGCSEEALVASLTSLREYGFINYYGIVIVQIND